MYPGRRSIRLKDYDYAQDGVYCVTICTKNRMPLFGEVDTEGVMQLSTIGEIVGECWENIPDHFPQVELDAFVVMPNHVHGIVVMMGGGEVGVRAQHVAPLQETFVSSNTFAKVAPGSLGAIVRSFKAAVTKRVRELPEFAGVQIWQRNYYEQIIRNERMLDALRQYIESNSENWLFDNENPMRIK